MRGCESRPRRWIALDLAAVAALFEVKTKELAMLKKQSLDPRQESGLAASGGF